MLNSLFFLFSHMFLSYSLMYYVIPKYVVKQKYVQAALVVPMLFFMTASLSAVIGMYLLPPLRTALFANNSLKAEPENSFFLSLLAGLRGAITVGGIAAAIKLMKYWYLKEQRNLQLQKENLEGQLQLLKAQVHPHFLFNTLNNIYSFSQKQSPGTTQMIADLSHLLRFVLYESSLPLVPLSKELDMVGEYIELEKIRYGNRLEVCVNVPGKTDHLSIAPLLLLPFIENCFKHGASNFIEHPWINLTVTVNGNRMQMKLVNGKTNIPAQSSNTSGIGISNVSKRLELLYPGKHELLISNEEDMFIVNLKIELESVKEKIEFEKQSLAAYA